MRYVKKYSSVKVDDALANRAEETAVKLEEMIRALDLKGLSLSEYGEKYFLYDKSKITFILQGYVFIVLSIANDPKLNYKEIAIIDHGGGIGFFSLFCKMLGFKTVIYNDLNPVVCEDARKIANALKIEIDHYSAGDAPALAEYIKQNNLSPRVLASRNVLEHIYDIDKFFKIISDSHSGDLSLFMSTTANMKNPLVNWYTRKIQKRFEREGYLESWGSKKTIPGTACVDVRKKLIEEKYPGLKKEEYSVLAKNTRGLILADIYKEVENFKVSGKYPVELRDATNTCDPYTGSWVEHLLPIKEYKRIAKNNGFTFDHRCGFYNTRYSSKMLNFVTPVLNLFIYVLGKGGLFLAPFMMIIAGKSKKA